MTVREFVLTERLQHVIKGKMRIPYDASEPVCWTCGNVLLLGDVIVAVTHGARGTVHRHLQCWKRLRQ